MKISSLTDIIDITDIYPIISHRTIRFRPINKIKYLMVHHSGSTNLSVPKLYELHTDSLHKWPTVGYHFYVTKGNLIYQFNKLTTITNGCLNFNTNCVHVCYEGNYEDEIAPYYFNMALEKILMFLKRNKIKVQLLAHKDKKNTLCPGKSLVNEIDKLRSIKADQQFLIWPEIDDL